MKLTKFIYGHGGIMSQQLNYKSKVTESLLNMLTVGILLALTFIGISCFFSAAHGQEKPKTKIRKSVELTVND